MEKKPTAEQETKADEEPKILVNKTPFKERIVPGMFFRRLMGWNYVELFMVLGPARPEDFEGFGEDRQFKCARVTPGIMGDAYELQVSDISTLCVKDMASEILLEYDSPTRYYFMNV